MHPDRLARIFGTPPERQCTYATRRRYWVFFLLFLFNLIAYVAFEWPPS